MVDTGRRVLHFYMPTGEQVNFCAHAAMGGITQLPHDLEKPFTFSSAMSISSQDDDGSDSTTTTTRPRQSTATIHNDNIVSLELRESWTACKIKQPPSLHRLLREACGVNASSLVVPPSAAHAFPTFVNYSTARPKTLIYMNSLQALHQARAPTNAQVFQRACDSLDTTGLYLYTPVLDNDDELPHTFECRQFPRASYPEDPATGIAASALAVALQQQTTSKSRQSPASYKFHQGTAMGRPSLILVENLEFHNKGNDNDDDPQQQQEQQEVSFRLLGQVQIDSQEEIQEDCDGV